MVWNRRRTRYRRSSNRRLLAKARNDRFERRVESIAKKHMETKAIKWAGAINFSAGFSGSSFFWILNPFTQMGEATDVSGQPTQDLLIGDKFILRGLKFEWNYAQTRDQNTRIRVSLISTDAKISNASGGNFDPGASVREEIFAEASETSADHTFQRFNVRNVTVLRSKEFRLVPQFSGANADTQGSIWWGTDQLKTRNEIDEADIDQNITYLKGKQYYWIVEMFVPMEISASWGIDAWYDRYQATVYYKDA